jgi:ATP-dependent protease ClpP protease subunit
MKFKLGNKFSMLAQGDTAEILIYEEIGSSFWGGGVDPKQFANDLTALVNVSTINLRINSPGGDVFDGATIYNLLKQHKATVNVYIDGLAASAASLIAMCGDNIFMADNAMMMIHNAWGVMAGDPNELRQFADVLEKVSASMCSTYSKRSGMKAADVQKMMDSTTWMNAQECVDNGFANQIVEQTDSSASARFDLSHFKNAPKAALDRFTTKDKSEEKESENVLPPSFYEARLKLYQRTQAV